MIQITPVMQHNILIIKEITTSKPKFPKAIVRFFLIVQLIFGINFGFSKVIKKKYQYAAKKFSLCLSICYILCLILPFIAVGFGDIWTWFNVIEYPAYFIVLNTLKYTVYDFISDINEINQIKKSQERFLKTVSFVYLLVMILIKLVLFYFHCHEAHYSVCQLTGFHFFLYNIPTLGMDALAITQILIYYYINCSVRNLKDFLSESINNINLVEIKYTNLADCYDKIRNLYDKMTILELGIGVPKMMITLWWMLSSSKLPGSTIAVITNLVFSFHIAVQIALPAIMSEIVNSQVDATKLVLNEYLRSERNEGTKEDINRLLRYMDVRKLNHFVLRFIPIDIRQTLAVFSLCTTYFIVIIQFTHLYD